MEGTLEGPHLPATTIAAAWPSCQLADTCIRITYFYKLPAWVRSIETLPREKRIPTAHFIIYWPTTPLRHLVS